MKSKGGLWAAHLNYDHEGGKKKRLWGYSIFPPEKKKEKVIVRLFPDGWLDFLGGNKTNVEGKKDTTGKISILRILYINT